MADNLEGFEGEALVRSLETQEQRIGAARLLREYHKETQKIIRLDGELNQQGKTLAEIREIEKGIADCEERRVALMGRMEQEYHAQTPRQLDIVLKQRGIDSTGSPDGNLGGLVQQKQNQYQGANQQGAQSEGRATSLEKDATALERIEESMQHLKKAMDEAEKAKKNYQLMQEEYDKAFAIMQQVNFELMQNKQLLGESRGGQLPQQQHDNILNPEIKEVFGTGSVSEARMSVRESLRNNQKTGQQEPVQESQKQSEKPRQPEEGKTRNKISGKELHGLYEVKEPPHHVVERGRRAEPEKEGKKGPTMG